jgi:hypothetical protein
VGTYRQKRHLKYFVSIENLSETSLPCVYDHFSDYSPYGIGGCSESRSNAVVADEIVKKGGVCETESCKTFESSRN